MGGLCLITIPAIIFVVNYITRKTKKISETRNKDYDLVNQNINEMFSNTLLIRMNNKEKEAQIEFDKLAYKLHTSTKKATFVSALQNAFININQYVNITIICIYALLMSIISNNTSAAYSIPSFLILISCAQIPYTSFSININGLASSINSLERCLKLLEEKECENDENKKTYDLDNIESIEFKNVDFSYNNETKTINNISISIKKNQKIALVGQTGCGKTTLINLLMHFYDVSEGEILINGININDIKSSQLRNLFSLISQEP
jgi:ATP-binding cassette subfamily B protein